MLIRTQTFPEIPELIPFPASVDRVEHPVISLDGDWAYQAVSAEEMAGQTPAEWGARLLETAGFDRLVPVPSAMDALHIEGFTGYSLCRRHVILPEGLPAGTRLALRLEAVNAHAAAFVNGQLVRAHENGLIAWTVDITPFVTDSAFDLVLALDDRSERVSAYNHGGIIHSVRLLLLPPAYLSALRVVAEPEADFAGGQLGLTLRAALPADFKASLRVSLADGEGVEVKEAKVLLPLEQETRVSLRTLPVKLWDAEHPNLYTLRLEVLVEGNGTSICLERVEQTVGFRQVTRVGNEVYLNGKELKLRGACRHETTALHGRATDPEIIEADVRLFLEANINYVRTSHYPPTEYFLDLCDRFGIYVEDELALAFIARTLDYTQQDPAYTQRYLSHFAETYARDNAHPCVIIWSLCNESFGGVNFDALNHYAHAVDPTRLTKFSYPMTLREEYPPVDVWSIHYGEWDLDAADPKDNVSVGGAYRRDQPVIHDEYVHVPCYNREEHRRDPGVRAFWGLSLARFWDRIWQTKGALGGAIWAGIDETDIYVGGDTKLEWGIIDIHRRKKPEHTMTRKAYSPLRLAWKGRSAEGGLRLSVENRFCHTNLSEATFRGWYLAEKSTGDRSVEDCRRAAEHPISAFVLPGPDIPPFGAGEMVLPGPEAEGAEGLYLECVDARGWVVDESLLPWETSGSQMISTAVEPSGVPLDIQEGAESWHLTARVNDQRLDYAFDKAAGTLTQVTVDGRPALLQGPRLHAPKLHVAPWHLEALEVRREGEDGEIICSGRYGDGLALTWRYRIHGATGALSIRMEIDEVNQPMPTGRKLRVGTDCGGLVEYGFSLTLPGGTDTFSWRRRGEYTVYPADFIGRNWGTARLGLGGASSMEHAAAGIPWKEDARHDMLNGLYDPGLQGSNDFTSMKPQVLQAAFASAAGGTAPLFVKPRENAPLHLRAEALPLPERVISWADPAVTYAGEWFDLPDPSAPYDTGERWSHAAGSAVTCCFQGTGIVWYGPVDVNCGKAAVFVDGERKAVINQRVDGVDFPGSAAGFDKKYHYPVYAITGLPEGEHTLTIEVLGEHAPDASDSYIAIESFYVFRRGDEPPVRLHLLRDFNFPQISWGNWKREPIRMRAGDSLAVELGFLESFR